MTHPLLAVENFSFSYDEEETPVIHNLSFSVKKGESLMLLGPSGSGKSSLALCLNGLYPSSIDGITTGDIFLDGKTIQAYPPGEISKRIGVVFQDPDSQFCMLTVEDEIAFGLENIHVPREEIAGRMDWALSLVGLQGYESAAIASLSGGMKQKLALACVLAMKPDILILDEPTALLDPLATKEFAETMKNLQNELGFSLLVIEHKLDHWLSFMDRCLVFTEKGELLFDGSPEECFSLYLKQLKEQGIWLPKPLLLSERLNLAGPLPWTEEDLFSSLDQHSFEKAEACLRKEDGPYTETILEIRNLSVSKGGKNILKNVNLRLPKGALTAIVGPNGAGKTTLSYMLAGLEKPDTGELFYRAPSSAENPKVGYVFQNPEHQFITDSVYEEIAFSLRMRQLSDTDIEQTVERILSVTRLENLKYQHPFSLSQGQKRRLSVATMLVDDQALLLLDEPTYGQDFKATEELMNIVMERVKAGMSGAMITHDMELVTSFAHHIIVLVAGEVLFEGPPHKLFSGPDWLLEKAQLEPPLLYAIRKKWTLRGELVAASNT